MDPNCLPPTLPDGWARSADGVDLPEGCVVGGRDLGGWTIVPDAERTDGLTLATRTVTERLPRLSVTGLARRSSSRETLPLRDEDVLEAAWLRGDAPSEEKESVAQDAGAEPKAAPAEAPCTVPDPDEPLPLPEVRELILARVCAG